MLRRNFIRSLPVVAGLLGLRRDAESQNVAVDPEPGEWTGAHYVRAHRERFGIAGDGATDDQAALARLVEGIGPRGGLLVEDVHALGSEWSLPCPVRFGPGGGFRWLRGEGGPPTISFRGGIEAGPHQIFFDSPPGGVRLGRPRDNGEWIGSAPEVRAEWWGARESAPAHENTLAIRSAGESLPQAGGTVVLGSGYFSIGGLELSRDGVTIRGQGRISTVLRFPGTEGIAVRFRGTRAEPRQFIRLQDLRIFGDATNERPGSAAGVVIEHTENWCLDNVYINGFWDGIRLDGVFGGNLAREVILLNTVRGIYAEGQQVLQLAISGLRHMDPIGPRAERRSILIRTGIADSTIQALQLQGTVEIAPTSGGLLGNLVFLPGTRISDTSGPGIMIDGERAAASYNVRLEGITVEDADGDGILVRRIDDITVVGACIRNAGRGGRASGISLDVVSGVVDEYQIEGSQTGHMVVGISATDADSLLVTRNGRIRGYEEAPIRMGRLTRSRVEFTGGVPDLSRDGYYWSEGTIAWEPDPASPIRMRRCIRSGTPGLWEAQGMCRGGTRQRPRLSFFDRGFTYWDTDLQRLVHWNGRGWDP